MTVMFSSSLFPYTQSFFIASAFFQNSFALGVIIVFTGALLHERPEQRVTWGTVIVALSFVDVVLLSSLSPTVPQSLYIVVGAIVSLLGGLLGLSSPSPVARPVQSPSS